MLGKTSLICNIKLTIIVGVLLVNTALAQSLEGDWVFRGFYQEVRGGPQKSSDFNFDTGAFTFTNTGGDNYRIRVVDQFETAEFDVELTKNGNVYSGSIPTDEEPQSTSEEEVRIILDGDFAYLVTLTWHVSTDAGFQGQSFAYNSVGYLMSRTELPTQVASRWSGNYAYRLVGQRQIWGQENPEELVDVPSITINANGSGGVANYQGSQASFDLNLGADTLGLAGQTIAPLSGELVENGSFRVDNNEVRRYAMAVQINDTEVVWMSTFVTMGAVNPGTGDEYYILTSAGTFAGRATRTVESTPEFTRNLPTEVAVLEGGDVFLSAEVMGAPAPQFQWYLSEANDPGPSFEPIRPSDSRFDLDYIGDSSITSTANLVLRNVTAEMDGYRFEVEGLNSAGNTRSTPTVLKVLSAPTARLPNLSVRTTLGAAQNLAVGFVMTGGSKPLLIRAVGPTLTSFEVGGAMPDPRIGFNDPAGNELDSNDDWGANLASIFGELGAFALTEGSKDAALRVDLSGLGTVSVNGPEGGTVLVEVYDIGESNDTRLVNVSARNEVGTGGNILIAGFVITGEDPKNMLIRAVGPELQNFGLTGTLNDPLLRIFRQTPSDPTNPILVGSNDNWSPGLRPSFVKTGAFDLTTLSLDAALVITLEPGAYTAQVSGADGGTGQAIVEIYELP